MRRPLRLAVPLGALALMALGANSAAAEDGKLRIIVFGAHPDDCELDGGMVGQGGAPRQVR